MNTTQQITKVDCHSENILEPDMANLLQMTNEVLLKIKQQTMEMSI